jgi:DNA-binding HxlR family transcriptional regulator
MILLDSTYDKEKVLDCMFDQDTSEILAELENGEKELSYLMEKLKKSENEIRENLSYLIEHSFVNEEKKENKIIYSVDAEKLSKLVEDDKNFTDVEDGLAKMDSYLN